jgi:hypothetical protein
VIIYWCQGEEIPPWSLPLRYYWIKTFSKKFEKPLDNHHKMWYNQRAVRDRNPTDN